MQFLEVPSFTCLLVLGIVIRTSTYPSTGDKTVSLITTLLNVKEWCHFSQTLRATAFAEFPATHFVCGRALVCSWLLLLKDYLVWGGQQLWPVNLFSLKQAGQHLIFWCPFSRTSCCAFMLCPSYCAFT